LSELGRELGRISKKLGSELGKMLREAISGARTVNRKQTGKEACVNTNRIEDCKILVDGIDTPRVMLYEALERLERTGDYDWAKNLLEKGIRSGESIWKQYSAKLGMDMDVWNYQVLPHLRSMVRMYDEKADIDDIDEATRTVDAKLYDVMFDVFTKCITQKDHR